KDSECAFVELKTHHEAWTGDKSIKRRFKIRNSELTGVRLNLCQLSSRIG
ncbi:unnamed protein product, partial [Ectocarpus sp. 8 AP-2014]